MKTWFIAFLSACACVGVLDATAFSVSHKTYDFNTLVVSGSGSGTAVLTIDGTQAASNVVSGAYTLEATGLTAGHVYKYEVTLGDDSDSGEFVMGNGTGKLFGADATGGSSSLTGVTADVTAPYVAPTVSDNQYVLQGSSNKFNVTSSPSGKIVHIDSLMTFTDGADELDETLEALGAFTLAQTNELTDAYAWMGLTGGATKWVELTGSVTAATGTCLSRMEFDFNASPARVRYLVGTDVAGLVVLKDASGNEWFDVAQDASTVSSVAYEGTGALAKMEGSSFTTNVASVDGTPYSTIAAALSQNRTDPASTVTLLTNTRPEANAALNGGSWTITEGGNSFEPYDATGYTHTYESGTFAVTPFETSVTVSGQRGDFGCDFTNGVLNVTIANAQIQSGAPVSLEVAVKDKSGTTIASQTYTGITGDTVKSLGFPAVGNALETKGEYTYEIVAKKGETQLATASGSFRVGNLANWFSANSSNWANGGAWSTNGEPVTVEGEKLALGGNTWDFTPVAPSVSNAFVRVDTVVELDGPIDNDDLPTTAGVQGMITLAETSAEDDTAVWKAFNGTEWITLTGGATAAGTYTVRAEFDYTRSPKAIRYSVASANGAFAVLMNGSEEWIANGVPAATTLAKTSAYGVGNLVSLAGDNLDAFVAEANGVGYETLAAALAAGGNVKLLWNCSWTPGRAGFWTIDANDKTLSIFGADGWDYDYQNGVLQASDKLVAAIGDDTYYLLTKAFAAVSANGTVTLLTNVVQGADIALANSANFDLAGWYVSGGAAFVPTDGMAVTVTNSTGDVGGFNLVVTNDANVFIKGGKWAATNSVGTLDAGYKFFNLAVTTEVDNVAYAFEAVHTTIEPSEAKVYPIAESNETVEVITDAVVSNSFIDTYIKKGASMTDEQIAVKLNSADGVANGLPPIQSYVLGLNPDSATSKPAVATAQSAETGKVALSLGNVNVNAAAGVKVTYSLSTADNASFSGATTTVDQDSSSFSADVPAEGSKVKYYRININFGK